MQINPLLLMLLILVLITVVGRVITWAGNMLGELEKQARERMREAERQRRALDGQAAGPPPRNPQEELEQMFALLTGQAPPRRAPPQAGQPARRPAPARPAPPPPPARPTRARVKRVEDEDEGGSTEGAHGGGLAAHHLHSAVEDKHLARLQPRGGAARDASLSGTDAAAASAVSGGAQAEAEGAERITDWIDGLPPLARGMIWSEVLGQPRIKLGPRLGPSARRA